MSRCAGILASLLLARLAPFAVRAGPIHSTFRLPAQASAPGHRRFRDVRQAIPADALARIERAVTVKVCETFGPDTSSVQVTPPSSPSSGPATANRRSYTHEGTQPLRVLVAGRGLHTRIHVDGIGADRQPRLLNVLRT